MAQKPMIAFELLLLMDRKSSGPEEYDRQITSRPLDIPFALFFVPMNVPVPWRL